MGDHNWGSDVPISRPEAPPDDQPSIVNFGGFGFSEGGMTFHTTEDEIQEAFLPHFLPRPLAENLDREFGNG